MSWYRGWDTLASVTRWHNFLEIAGIVCLALLVGTEILAFQYGHRKDALIVAAEEAVAEQRRRDPDATETRRKAEMEAAEARGRTEVDGQHNRLTEADKKVTDLEKQQADRWLTSVQQQQLVAALSRFSGQKIRIIHRDGEGGRLGQDFLNAFKAAGWDVGGGMAQGMDAGDFVGMQLSVNDTDQAQDLVPPGAFALAAKLTEFGFIRQGFAGAHIPSGEIELSIGRKPPPN